ncbi:hypothetical protein ACQP1K_00165 [Sphaerimonospora sp. CA-214678]|uniref:hypothetical protein n=1 Tax=Sphaerimonospora sp. CA-214678 TaxID=3240029 RepID=UPI003D8B847D
MIAVVLGLFFLHVISCCTIARGNLLQHHHHIAADAVSAGDDGGDRSSSHPECGEESNGLWMRGIDGQDPLQLETIAHVLVLEESRVSGPPVRRAPSHIPNYRAGPYALCVLRI